MRSRNGFTWLFGTRRPDGSCCLPVPGFANILVSSDAKKSWYDALFLTAEKPYTANARWGFSLHLHAGLGRADRRRPVQPRLSHRRRTTRAIRRQTTSGTASWPRRWSGLPWDLLGSTFITLGDGLPYNVDDQSLGGGPNERQILRNGGRPEGTFTYKSIDLRLEKAFRFGARQQVSVIAEAFNIFDHSNYKNFDGFIPTPPATNPNFGQPRETIDPAGGCSSACAMRSSRWMRDAFPAAGDPAARSVPRRLCAVRVRGRAAGRRAAEHRGAGGLRPLRGGRCAARGPLAPVVPLLLGARRPDDRHRPRPRAHGRVAHDRRRARRRQHRLGRLRPERPVHRRGRGWRSPGTGDRARARDAALLRRSAPTRTTAGSTTSSTWPPASASGERAVLDRHRAPPRGRAHRPPVLRRRRRGRPAGRAHLPPGGLPVDARRPPHAALRTAGGRRRASSSTAGTTTASR